MASSDIDDAVVVRLMNDTTLMAETPDGVYFDVAKPDATRYVLVSIVHDDRDDTFDPAAPVETMVYAVKAVMLASAGGQPKAAETRIDDLLHNGTLALPPTYSLVDLQRLYPDGRIRYAERDDVDKSIRWHHRGGRYRVSVQRVSP